MTQVDSFHKIIMLTKLSSIWKNKEGHNRVNLITILAMVGVENNLINKKQLILLIKNKLCFSTIQNK
jgi:hypothetical protein